MSYFAGVRCPRCKKEQQLHLGWLGFYGMKKVHCSYCGFDYNPQNNCFNMEADRDSRPSSKKNSAETKNDELEKYSKEIDSLRKENEMLKNKIEELSKLMNSY